MIQAIRSSTPQTMPSHALFQDGVRLLPQETESAVHASTPVTTCIAVPTAPTDASPSTSTHARPTLALLLLDQVSSCVDSIPFPLATTALLSHLFSLINSNPLTLSFTLFLEIPPSQSSSTEQSLLPLSSLLTPSFRFSFSSTFWVTSFIWH